MLVVEPIEVQDTGFAMQHFRHHEWFGERARLWALLNRESSAAADLKASHVNRAVDPDHRAVVIGFGPTGRTVVRLLRDNGVAPTVIELNMGAVRALREDGIDAIYGDAMRPETLAGC